jgi:hypothetical protein
MGSAAAAAAIALTGVASFRQRRMEAVQRDDSVPPEEPA